MKKGVQIAFAIVLVILSLIATIKASGIMEGIIYAVVVPSFILSIISFISDISLLCEHEAKEKMKINSEASYYANKWAKMLAEKYEIQRAGIVDEDEIDPQKILDAQDEAIAHNDQALVSADIRIVCFEIKKWSDRASVGCYVVLFLSLIFSPYIAQWLSVIDLNCITLWSLTLLYFTLELKSEIAGWLFKRFYTHYEKKIADESKSEQVDEENRQ